MHIHKGWSLALLLVVGALLMPGMATAQIIAEFDFNATLGDDPDTVNAALGDTVSVDLWFVAPSPTDFIGVTVVFCADSSLTFIDADYDLPPDWTADPAVTSDSCVVLNATDGAPEVNPATNVVTPQRIATLRYLVVRSQPLSAVFVLCDPGGDGSTWRDTDGNIQPLGCEPGTAYVTVSGSTATDQTTWGRIKGLFR